MPALDPWYVASLACPLDKSDLNLSEDHLVCDQGHRYPIVDGTPNMLPHLEELPFSRSDAHLVSKTNSKIDPYVQMALGATNGIMYKNLQLNEYPIPALPLPPGKGKRFLDLGSNWGRWCVAASRLGYEAVGLDPNPEAIRAAKRVAKELGVSAHFVVGDARHLPFKDNQFDVVFSYSVLQHFPKEEVSQVLVESKRVLREGGQCLIQMANALGLRNVYHQFRRGLRRPTDFEVRYWTVQELKSVFGQRVGPAKAFVDGFFSLNVQKTQTHLLPWKFRCVSFVSELLRKLSCGTTVLTQLADSVYLQAEKRGVR